MTRLNLSVYTQARFWSKVDVNIDDRECWLWKGAKTGNGYGNFSVQELSSKVPAHRVSYCLSTGDYPDAGLVVRHKCDNPLCVNPRHLEIGTQADNMNDMIKRGRRTYAPRFDELPENLAKSGKAQQIRVGDDGLEPPTSSV